MWSSGRIWILLNLAHHPVHSLAAVDPLHRLVELHDVRIIQGEMGMAALSLIYRRSYGALDNFALSEVQNMCVYMYE